MRKQRQTKLQASCLHIGPHHPASNIVIIHNDSANVADTVYIVVHTWKLICSNRKKRRTHVN